MDMTSFCSKLFDILNTSKQMQQLIEKSAALFGNPIGMGFYDFTVLYVSSDMPNDSLNATPGTMSFFDHPEVLADLEKVYKSDMPLFFPQKVNTYAHIISALRYENCVIGYISSPLSNRDFESDDIQKFECINRAIEYAIMTEKGSQFRNHNNKTILLKNLVSNNGNLTDDENLWKQLGFSPSKILHLILIASEDLYFSNAPARPFREAIEQVLSSDCYYNREGKLIFLCQNFTKKTYSELCLLLKESHLIGGMGYPFYRLQEAAIQYENALKALTLHSKTKNRIIYDFSEVMPETLFYSAGSLVMNYIHPVVYQLADYDNKNQTHYLDTLYAYLVCQRNIQKSAKLLQIHRNTLIQRLDRIQEFIGEYMFCADAMFHLKLSMDFYKLSQLTVMDVMFE